jgi:peptidoglycan/LPS O-acetylase OafA/YrhL
MAAAIAVLRVSAPWAGTSLFDAMTPFSGVLAAQAAGGTPIFMGLNTAHILLTIAASEVLRWKDWPTASQFLGCCAMVLLFVALIGYTDDLHSFYGRLAPLTFVGASMLVVSALSATHQQGFIRSLVAQSGNRGRLPGGEVALKVAL